MDTDTNDRRVHDALTTPSWQTIRHALTCAMTLEVITYEAYVKAMTEVMGTPDKSRW